VGKYISFIAVILTFFTQPLHSSELDALAISSGSITKSFSIEQLENEYPQTEFSASFRVTKKDEIFSGPLLYDLMEQNGFLNGISNKEANIIVYASDGFVKKIPLKTLKHEGGIIATRINQNPISVEYRGPLMVAFPSTKKHDNEHGHHSFWVWFVEEVSVEIRK